MGFAIRMKKPGISASPLGPAPSAAPAEEDGETCSATITSEQLDELQAKGSVTLQGDDGESVVLTLDEGGGEPDEGEEE